MIKKIILTISLCIMAYSLSMCKNIFSAASEPITDNYHQQSLPKTGQTTVYQTGDDGEYQRGAAWPSPRFRNNGNGTITDRLTGLMWQQSGSYQATGGWADALSHCKSLTTGGYTDWRLPNINELRSLVHYGYIGTQKAWLESQGFTHINDTNHYGSASTNDASNGYAWVITANTLSINERKDVPLNVLAVRGNSAGAIGVPQTGQTTVYQTGDDGEYQRGAAWPSPRFSDNGNGTITDRLTGLMWQQSGSYQATAEGWTEALSHCKSLTTGGYTDWRLPNINELASLVNFSQANPAEWLNTQGFTGIQSASYFSATTHSNNTSEVWYVNMDSGIINPADKNTNNYVLAVRDGQ